MCNVLLLFEFVKDYNYAYDKVKQIYDKYSKPCDDN